MKKFYYLMLAALLFVLPFLTHAQSTLPAVVRVTGEVLSPFAITDAEFPKFKQSTISRKDHDGKDHVYTGILLSEILQKAGATMGPDLKGKNLTKYLLITAADNYQVVFALAELDKAFTDRMIILADQVDGKPLPAGEGPFRVIIQDEKKPARCIRQVTKMQVIAAK